MTIPLHSPEVYVMLGLLLAAILTSVVLFAIYLNRTTRHLDPATLDEPDEFGTSENDWNHAIR